MKEIFHRQKKEIKFERSNEIEKNEMKNADKMELKK